MPRGTKECPRCSWPGDLLKKQGGKSTLGFPPGRAGGWCGVGSGSHADRGSVEAEVGDSGKEPGTEEGERGKTADMVGGESVGQGGEG